MVDVAVEAGDRLQPLRDDNPRPMDGLHTTLATPKPRSRKRTYSYRIASMKTLRFLLINRAARLARISGHKVLRFSSNPATQTLYDRVAYHLAA
jgi:hypothetical protein